MAEYKLDDKLKKALLGAMPFSCDVEIAFNPLEKSSIPEEVKPLFYVTSFTNEEKKEARAIVIDGYKKNFDQLCKLLHKKLSRWENVFDLATGKKIEYDGTLEKFLVLPESIIIPMFDFCNKISGIYALDQLSLK